MGRVLKSLIERRRLAGFLLGCLLTTSAAADFRSIARDGAVLYEGPFAQSKRLYVVSPGLPVEIIASDGAWAKVREPQGSLGWVERDALSTQRTVIVTVPLADIREHPDSQSAVIFQAAQDVVLELQDSNTPGWLRVRHRDGSTGFVRLNQVWGG